LAGLSWWDVGVGGPCRTANATSPLTGFLS
jgi:hypothetical protein